jgi:hypothetical protein
MRARDPFGLICRILVCSSLMHRTVDSVRSHDDSILAAEGLGLGGGGREREAILRSACTLLHFLLHFDCYRTLCVLV